MMTRRYARYLSPRYCASNLYHAGMVVPCAWPSFYIESWLLARCNSSVWPNLQAVVVAFCQLLTCIQHSCLVTRYAAHLWCRISETLFRHHQGQIGTRSGRFCACTFRASNNQAKEAEAALRRVREMHDCQGMVTRPLPALPAPCLHMLCALVVVSDVA